MNADVELVAEVAVAPFTVDQVASFNAWQDYALTTAGSPWRCDAQADHHVLVAIIDDGLVCLDCPYTFAVTPAWMTDWSWATPSAK